MEMESESKFGLWGGVFAILSTVIGGGMVAIPWAFQHVGYYLAVIMSFMAGAQVILSSILFLSASKSFESQPK